VCRADAEADLCKPGKLNKKQGKQGNLARRKKGKPTKLQAAAAQASKVKLPLKATISKTAGKGKISQQYLKHCAKVSALKKHKSALKSSSLEKVI
jgi:hypothetical protein